jgi:hypothetical protein
MRKGIDANDVGRSIQSLVDKHGEARPEHIVKAARSEKHPLHAHFEWDDSEAAKQHRLEQARYVLRAVTIVREDRPDVTIRAFVNVEREGAWNPIDVVLASPTGREQLLAQALSDLQALSRKYHVLEELEDVRSAIARLADEKREQKEAA